MNKKQIAIYTITYNRLNYTKRLFDGLEQSISEPYDHFIVDNGSTDGTVDFLKLKFPDLTHIIFNKENKGIATAQNQALNLIGDSYKYIIKLDNDMEFITKNWITGLIEVSQKMKDNIVLSPYIDFGIKDDNLEKKLGIERTDRIHIAGHELSYTKHVGGAVRFASNKIYQSYRWDENVPLISMEDVAFSEFCFNQGIQMGYVEDLIALHETEQHMKDYSKYYKSKDILRYTSSNKNNGLKDKIIIYIKAKNFYYSDYGAGNDTIIGKIFIPIKKKLKNYLTHI